jgi:hypothetical protein
MQCEAKPVAKVLHLVESLSAEVQREGEAEDYPEATEEQKANLTKLFREV